MTDCKLIRTDELGSKKHPIHYYSLEKHPVHYYSLKKCPMHNYSLKKNLHVLLFTQEASPYTIIHSRSTPYTVIHSGLQASQFHGSVLYERTLHSPPQDTDCMHIYSQCLCRDRRKRLVNVQLDLTYWDLQNRFIDWMCSMASKLVFVGNPNLYNL